jgi:protein NrfD
MDELITTRSNHLIDPIVHVWHYEVAVYLFLGGVVAGLMALTGLWLLMRKDEARSMHLSLLPWTAPILLSVGMFFLWLDLENPFNTLRFYFVFKPTSPMSWGSWILLAIYPASILMAWLTTPDAIRARVMEVVEARARRLSGLVAAADKWILGNGSKVAWLNVAAGVGLGIYTGLLLGTMAARPLWNSAILGPLFLTSGLSTGAAYMLLYSLKDNERVFFTRLDMGLILVELTLLAIWLIGMASGGALSQQAMALIVSGAYAPAFWGLVVGIGLVGPFLGEWMEQAQGHIPGRLAAFLVLVGGFALRWIIVYAGQHSGFASSAVALF